MADGCGTPGGVRDLPVTAQRIAAEHFAFCDECAGQGLRDISKIAASLVDAPTWIFWCD